MSQCICSSTQSLMTHCVRPVWPCCYDSRRPATRCLRCQSWLYLSWSLLKMRYGESLSRCKHYYRKLRCNVLCRRPLGHSKHRVVIRLQCRRCNPCKVPCRWSSKLRLRSRLSHPGNGQPYRPRYRPPPGLLWLTLMETFSSPRQPWRLTCYSAVSSRQC